MKLYKIVFTFIVLFFSLNHIVLADDIDENLLTNFSTSLETSVELNSVPTINSRSAIIFDRTTGSILYGKNENEKRKMASTTKIMTAIIVIENANLSDTVIISAKSAGTGGSRLGLHTNDKISVQDLLYGLMLCSGNDSAVALAEYVGGSIEEFANLMNEKSNLLGLSSTHFVTPHGLDNDSHYTTAYELSIITDYALKNETFRKYVSTKNCTVLINGTPKTISNTNELLGNLNGVYGVKTGFTNGANRCLVTSVKRNDMDLICVVLGADTKKDRTRDSIQLIEYAFNNFKMINIKEKVLSEFENWKLCNHSSFRISKGVSNDIELYLKNLPFDFFPVNCNQEENISICIYCKTSLEAPLLANTAIGYLTLSLNDKNILSLDIYNKNDIPKKQYNDFWNDLLKNYIFHLESLLYEKNTL